jgi:hypothetical protein
LNIDNGAEFDEIAPLTEGSKAVEHGGDVSAKADGLAFGRLRLGAVWHLTRHLLEMVVAMMAGMAMLGVAVGTLGEPPGYSSLLVEYGLMGVSMSAPMVAWMRYRGHSWLDGVEMTAAMLLPTFALVLPVELGVAGYVPGLSEDSLMMLSHVAMIAGMAALMVYRRDRYAHGTHDRRD